MGIRKKMDHKTRFIRVRFVNIYGLSTDEYINFQLMVQEVNYPYPVHDIYIEPDKIGKIIFLSIEEVETELRKLQLGNSLEEMFK